MVTNKIKLFVATLLSINAFSFSGSVDTNVSITPIFEPKYKTTGYNFTIADLKLKPIDQIELFAVLKSDRKSAEIADQYNLTLDKKDRVNHDIMAKLGANLKYNIYKDLNLTSNITYYLDDFYTPKIKDKNGDIQEDYKSEFIENDGSKNALGNILLEATLSGKINDVDLNVNAKYKANQLHRFDRDESYFIFNTSVDSKLDDTLSLKGKYDFNIDLDQMSKPFDAFKTDFEEYPDYMVGDYLTYFTQKSSLELNKKLSDKLNFKTILNFNHTAFYTRETKDGKYKTYYNVLDPTLKFSLENKIDVAKGNLIIENILSNNFETRLTHIVGEKTTNDEYESKGLYAPTLENKLKYNLKENKHEFNIDTLLSYGIKFVYSPYVVALEKLKHQIDTNLNLKYKYDFNESSSVLLENNTKLQTELKKETVPKLKGDTKLTLEYSNKFNDNFSLKTGLKNLFSSKTQKRNINPDILNEDAKVYLETEYKPISGEKETISLKNDLEYRHSSRYNYVLRTNNKEISFNDNEKINNHETGYGEAILTDMVNTLQLKTKLNYENKISSKLILNTGIDLSTKIEDLVLRNERMYNYNSLEKDIPEGKMNPLLSDDIKMQHNFGGSIEITPNVSLSYKPIEQLELSTKIDTLILFERKVVDKINNEDRPDNELYGAIDKSFGYKKLVPKVSFSLGYNW